MKIKNNIDFYRVHIIGRTSGRKLRPSVAKYVRHKDRETVRHTILGSKVDKVSCIKEQFFQTDVVD